MTHLSVNVNKLATLRNSRGKNTPDVCAFAKRILQFGAHGITVHPRPDGRHIRLSDVRELGPMVRQAAPSELGRIEFNIEGYPSEDFIALIEEAKSDQATLVPDPPEVITSNAGWNLVREEKFLSGVIPRLQKAGARVSLFIDPFEFDTAQEQALKRLHPERIELYTERFHDDFPTAERDATTRRFREVAQKAVALGIEVNAGHDLNQENLGYLLSQIPEIKEVSIGHALMCEALNQGMETTIRNYLKIIHQAHAVSNPHAARAER